MVNQYQVKINKEKEGYATRTTKLPEALLNCNNPHRGYGPNDAVNGSQDGLRVKGACRKLPPVCQSECNNKQAKAYKKREHEFPHRRQYRYFHVASSIQMSLPQPDPVHDIRLQKNK